MSKKNKANLECGTLQSAEIPTLTDCGDGGCCCGKKGKKK